jgi:hypothetical protein
MAFTAEELVKTWQARAGRVDSETRKLVQRTGRRMLTVSRAHMRAQIYAIPEDKTKSGKKKWVRTGTLLRNETLIYAPDGSAVTLTNETIYARARHELGRDGRQTKRPAHWREGIHAEMLDGVHADMIATRDRIFRAAGGSI